MRFKWLSCEDSWLLPTSSISLRQFPYQWNCPSPYPTDFPHCDFFQRWESLRGSADSVKAAACISIDRISARQSAYISSCYSWFFYRPTSDESKVRFVEVRSDGSRNVTNAFLSDIIVSKHNLLDTRTFIVRPINAYIREKYKVCIYIYIYVMKRGKNDAPKKKVDKMNTFACTYTPR